MEKQISRDNAINLLRTIVQKIFSERVFSVDIASHPSADIDSVASAVALSLYLRSLGAKEICFLTRQNLDPIAKKVIDIVRNRELFEICDVERGEILFIVDASSCSRAGVACERYKYVFVIDHHEIADLESNNINIVIPDATSSTEILLEAFIINNDQITLDKEFLDIFLASVLYETNILSIATEKTNENIKWLIEKGASLANALSIIRRELRYDEKIARLKGLMRAHVYRTTDKKIICLTHVSAHESLVANYMISGGCDLAVVVSDKESEIWVVARCSESLCRDLGLGELFMNDLRSVANANWGGHSRAAVAKIPRSREPSEVIELITSILRSRLGYLEEIKT